MTGRVLAGSSAAVGVVGIVVYLAVISSQDGEISSAASAWASVMALPTVLALAATFARFSVSGRRLLVIATAVLNGVLGLLGIFTIGIIFLIASLLAWGAAFFMIPAHATARR
jgi:hypothetical protein